MATKKIEALLGANADNLLNHTCKAIPKESIHLPGGDFVDRIFMGSNRNPQVLRSLQQLYGTGRLANTGYMSILPVDQGIEHSAGASFAETTFDISFLIVSISRAVYFPSLIDFSSLLLIP